VNGYEKAIALVASALGVSPDSLSGVSRINDRPEWDSLGQAGILVRLEEAGVPLDDDIIRQAESIGGLAEILAGRVDAP
jgi:hypothetical protein